MITVLAEMVVTVQAASATVVVTNEVMAGAGRVSMIPDGALMRLMLDIAWATGDKVCTVARDEIASMVVEDLISSVVVAVKVWIEIIVVSLVAMTVGTESLTRAVVKLLITVTVRSLATVLVERPRVTVAAECASIVTVEVEEPVAVEG